MYQELNETDHRRPRVRTPRTTGFVERFNGTVLDEFFREAFRTTLYETEEALQEDLDRWLNHYKLKRPHQGYRSMGRRPIDTINQHLESVRKEDKEDS